MSRAASLQGGAATAIAQLTLLWEEPAPQALEQPNSAPAAAAGTAPELNSYDRIVVAFSGGKDSIACVLHMLELGVPRERLELHHHCVDGNVAHGDTAGLMDWPVTESYCKAFGKALGIPVYLSWRQGGFEREMLRQEQPTAAVHFESPDPQGDGVRRVTAPAASNAPMGTRRRFPQVSADLSTRWCSAYLKIGVADRVFTNDARFANSRTLVVTGERAQESACRARYQSFEPDRADARKGRKARHIDHWRAVHAWNELQVWEILERWKVNPHPAYRVGFSRASCMKCIFGSDNQWASVNALDPAGTARIAAHEREFGVTIHRSRAVTERVAAGQPYPQESGWASIAMRTTYDAPIFDPNWTLPIGAYGASDGPT